MSILENKEKVAIISMDVEDWYHLDYVAGDVDKTISMLDGFDKFIEICSDEKIPATYFCLSDLVNEVKSKLPDIQKHGGEIAMHGTDHARPLSQSVEYFVAETDKGRRILEKSLGVPIEGYRAPCFSLDRERLNLLMELGFKYDSSKIDFGSHPLYGALDVTDFKMLDDGVLADSEFFEFEIPTYKKFGRTLPISGGGYIRILPWFLLRQAISSYISKNNNFFVFMHPFELSSAKAPKNLELKALTDFRFRYGIPKTPSKFRALIHMLKQEGYCFKTFSQLRNAHLESS